MNNDRVKELEGLLRQAVGMVNGATSEWHDRVQAALSQQAEPVCDTMQRPKAVCGCPDCGSSLIELERDAAKWRRDSELLDAIESECWDVRFLSTPNADAGDSSISIEIVGHFMAEPRERVVGENYHENLRAALEQAKAAEAYPPARPEYDEHGRPVRAMVAQTEIGAEKKTSP